MIHCLRLNAALLAAVALPIPQIVKLGALFLIPLSYSIVFFEERDSLILAAGEDRRRVNVFSAVGSLVRSFYGTISPFLILTGFEGLGPLGLAGTLFVFQAALAGARLRRSR